MYRLEFAKPAVFLLLLSLCSACGEAGIVEDRHLAAKMSETAMWNLATEKPMPSYPPSALDAGIGGVAIAEVEAGENGEQPIVRILDAPNPDIATSVREALTQWRFELVTIEGREEVYRARGTVTVYFVPDDGGSVVRADEMPAAEASGIVVSADGAPEVREISEDELDAFLANDDGIILDIGLREGPGSEPRDNAVWIPLNELPTRARVELPASKTIVIDCKSIAAEMCQAAPGLLAGLGFSKIAVIIPA